MALCWPSLILLIFAATIRAADHTLTTEFTNLIPSCAQQCFVSFLDVNFPVSLYGVSPSLNTLCTKNSTSGYTVGEGAVQCIISEDNIGFCEGDSANESVVIDAYSMCDNVANALPETHSTLTATLVIQTGSPSILLVATPTSTSSSTVRASSTLRTTASSTQSSTTSSATMTVPKTSSTSTTGPAQSAVTTATPTSLSKAQVAGISVAAVGGVAVTLGLVICLACWRRKQIRRKRDSDLIPFQNEPPAYPMNNQKQTYSFQSPASNLKPAQRIPGGTSNGIAGRVTPPVPPRLDTSDPNIFARREIRPETIGVAISPENRTSQDMQKHVGSREGSMKPNLKVSTSQSSRGGLSFSKPRAVHPVDGSRLSIDTEFEDDDESADTAVAADDPFRRSSTDQMLNNSPMDGKTIRPVYAEPDRETLTWRPGQAPQSATISPAGVVDLYVRPLSIGGRNIGSFSKPRVPASSLAPPSANTDGRPITGTSSIYTDRSSLASTPHDIGRSLTAPQNLTQNPKRTYRNSAYPPPVPESSAERDEEDGIISLSFSPIQPLHDRRASELRLATTANGKDLSPVVESPTSGRSPVSYPKIPEARSPTIRRVDYGPPPAQPDFSVAAAAGQRGDRSSAMANQPWRAAEIKAQRERERVARERAEETIPLQQLREKNVGSKGHKRQTSGDMAIAMNFPLPPTQAVRTNTPPRSDSAPREVERESVDATGGWEYHPYDPNFTRSLSQSGQPQPQRRPQQQAQAQNPYRQPQPSSSNQQPQRPEPQQIPTSQTTSSTTLPTLLNPFTNPSWEPQTPRGMIPKEFTSQGQPNRAPYPTSASTQQPSVQSNKQPTLQPSLMPQFPTLTHAHAPSQTSPLSLTQTLSHTSALSSVSQQSTQSKDSQTSNLLQKRLGAQKASQLALQPINGVVQKKQVGMWKVLGGDNGGGQGGREGREEWERVELPITPGWVPKLTPTRRGEDLFLAVA